ncbi:MULTISPECIES: hypothetical protein [unclassified Pseudomonas]|uniref:hypothetical protein n=1 Tax=unclassified Pseudomonas TaxID=196821 RepID=UPI0021144C16|nr:MULTISPECIES: hypothetical protein [unclassified Pseudomonas]
MHGADFGPDGPARCEPELEASLHADIRHLDGLCGDARHWHLLPESTARMNMKDRVEARTELTRIQYQAAHSCPVTTTIKAMIKFAGILPLFISLASCAAQQVYNNHVYVENRCDQPLEMKISNSSNLHSLERNVKAEAGSRALVASFASYGEDVIEQIPGNYSLTITDAVGTKVVDGAQLRQRLSGVKKMNDGTQREWTINDASFCP